MGRFWSLLFLLVPILGVLLFVLGPTPVFDAWLPEDISTDGHLIDHLFMFILYLTGAVFVATELVLFWYLWHYDAAKNAAPVKYTHGSHSLEVVWTILPAATLLFIAIYQINAWADIKMRPPRDVESGMTLRLKTDHLKVGHLVVAEVEPGSPAYLAGITPGARLLSIAGKSTEGVSVENVTKMLAGKQGKTITLHTEDREGIKTYRRLSLFLAPLAEVTGRQFEWRIRYPGPDAVLHTADDLHTVNDLHVPVEEDVLLVIKSQDVLHSFFLPNMRLKQDVVPGMRQHMWFRATKTGQYDIVCAELCGWGHYKMKGKLTVESRVDYLAWLAQELADQNTTTEPLPTSEEE